ncbi:hypothetical protein K1719_006736 [Acacia pycnantha]|nr:hypothetical protein K1719_006736 [Acacia pycnantha]
MHNALSNAATISDSKKEISNSFSLGLAVLLGFIYYKENVYWSGFTIAISFITKRQAAFSVANDRGQGTAMGSIYGILCCFLFERSYVEFKVLATFAVGCLIFSCFLMHGSMYISAVLGGLLLLGRKDYGPPAQFAIASLRKDYGP